MIRRYLIFLILLWPTLTVATERPNILVLMAEDMSSRVGAFGDAVAATPNLDALAAQGVRYSNAFTTAGVCAPSRATHILGMHQISTGSQHMRTSGRPEGGYFSVPPAEAKAYPELMRRAGYYTFTDQKLDYQFSGPRAGSGPPTIWSDEGVRDWSGRTPGQPFFGLVNFQATHESGIFSPLGSMPNSAIHFASQLLRRWSLGAIEYGVTAPDSVQLEPYYPDTPTVREDIARHYDNIAHMDREIGQVLEQLQAEGLADSTIVIWTTDHGDGLPRAKRELYDSGIRVPMIIRWPEQYRPEGVEPGQWDQRLVSFVDLGPTILSLAGIEPPPYMQGRNFIGNGERRQYIYASRDRIDEVPDRQRAVRDERFKYIRSWHPELPGGHRLQFRENINMVVEMQAMHASGQLNPAQEMWFSPPGKERLFDLEKDPHELTDVSTDPAYSAELARMRQALDNWLASIEDWSDTSEADMVARFYPDGQRQQAPTPNAKIVDGMLILENSNDENLSFSYRVEDGPWQLYLGNTPVGKDKTVEVRSVRYGWETSETKALQSQ